MSTRVLIIIDKGAPQPASDAFEAACPNWQFSWVTGLPEALESLRNNGDTRFVVCDVEQPQTTGAQILTELSRQFPQTVRAITGGIAEKEMISQFVLAPHYFLAKPLDPKAMRTELLRALSLERWIGCDRMRSLLAGIRTFPSVPAHYLEVLKELRSEEPSAFRVGEIIASDLAMYTKILQVLNSPYYGFSRHITDPTEAVAMLGFEMVKSLVLSIQVFSQFSATKLPVVEVDNVWRHSTRVAQAARRIAEFENADRRVADEAFTAGLMHDIGKLILISNFASQYREAQDNSRQTGEPISHAEQRAFGVTHGEISAYLLVSWGMALSMGEAVAYHNYPARSDDTTFSPLCAVHAADVLAREVDSDAGSVYLSADEDYLCRIGLSGRTELWRNLLQGRSVSLPTPQEDSANAPDSVRPAGLVEGLVSRFAFWKKK